LKYQMIFLGYPYIKAALNNFNVKITSYKGYIGHQLQKYAIQFLYILKKGIALIKGVLFKSLLPTLDIWNTKGENEVV
jgi:hypothetical protein